MPNHASLGRGLVLVAIGLILSSSVATIVLYIVVQGSDRLVAQVVRFGLTCLLAWFLWRGRAWARWVAVILFGIAIAIGVRTASEYGFANFNTFLLVSYTLALGILLGGPGVGRHFARGHSTPVITRDRMAN